MKKNAQRALGIILLFTLLISCSSEQSSEKQSEVKEEKRLVPGEQAPLANPDQNSFGWIRRVGTSKYKKLPFP